ncbi:Rab-GTPase-TBC domain-containing protein [Cynara cardunculus var. scolymus]|uniref:Rab-GTPase-TBC domain-containing protein n=2 Tax=Cynara cardunculus var. scolymus TaxID=59895 RepID=A0A103Y2P3_CYNCS|nr:Rab-GTPase-TBC domain-containing protein [Cynara cardunculus var. scolymus]
MSPAALVEPTTKTLPESSLSTRSSPERGDLDKNRRFWDLRGVQWRTDLGVLPSSSSVDDVRRVTANSRRSYAALRRRLLIDPLIPKDGSDFPDLTMDNPLSQDPDSTWGRFFQKAELEKMVDQDLSRLYPEHGSYFQTPRCQAMLRRILLLWCIHHPNYGYRQGMHELLAPLLFVLQADVERLSAVRKLYEHYFTDNFDGLSFHETDSAYKSNLKQISRHIEDDSGIQENQVTVNNLDELDPKIQTIILFSDAYGAEGELGIVLSERFMEHDAYCMFDALMNGAGGAVAMANFFSPPPLNGPQNGLPPVIEASSVLYHLLAVVDSSLYTHLVELGVEPQYFALRWLRVLYGREFALADLLVIWDAIFSFDNRRLDVVSENDPDLSFGGLNSSRGAFIAALAVSMILYIRSSILATETATSCLQRLLNFPNDVNLGKLMKKANSLVALAIDSMRLMPPAMHSDGVSDRSKLTVSRGHSLSFDVSASGTGTPVSLLRDSYWEEKWRVLHKEEEEKQTIPQKQVENRPKGWSEKVKLQLLRTESDPSSSKVYHAKTGPSRPRVRRNLLDDLARQLGLEEEIEKLASKDDSTKRSLSGNGGSEENSSVFSDPPTPTGGDANDNDHENDTERSSVASNISVEENGPEHCPPVESFSATIPEVSSPLPVCEAPEPAPLPPVQNEDSIGKLGSNLKERISLAGKFQWLWKFGKNGGDNSTTEKGAGVSDSTKSSIVGQDQNSETAASAMDVKSVNQNTTCSLKNLGESMVENLQVIESVIQQEKGETGSKKALLVDRGQMTAMAALKELRKISNILSEM